MITRRTVLKGIATATIGAALSRTLPISAARLDVPDAGGFIRLDDWCVCVPAQEWGRYGNWVIDGVMAALQPARWHSWGIWPAGNVAGRVPAIFSDRYFDRAATRQYLIDHPGREWGSFNEPEIDRREKIMPGMALDDKAPEYMSPQLAVDVTLEFIDLAKSVGNEFQWMAPSITLDTSHDGLGWLTEYMSLMRRKKGIMRPGSWGIHPYGCNTVPALRQSMRKWWDWHAVWGSGAPTKITEVCAEGENVAGQIAVMDECAAMLKRKEVSTVAWASAYYASAGGTNWLDYPLCNLHPETQTVTLTPLGRRWKELRQRQ